LSGFRIQLETVQSGLQSDPSNADLQALVAELEEAIAATESLIEELKPAPVPQQAPSPTEENLKWSKENHPAFQPGYRKPGAPPPPEEQGPVTYKVNDTVLGRWLSGDKGFYPARVTSITGSSTNPVYYVTFKSYGNTEALRGPDIKPMNNSNNLHAPDSKKRKADGSPASSSTPTPAPTNVITAVADINPALATAAKKEPSLVGDGPPKPAKIPKKIKAKRELEAGKSKWQDFTSKGKSGKTGKKDSMFRTGDSVTARVGFTGSGQAMRKDVTRSRHVYQAEDEDNY